MVVAGVAVVVGGKVVVVVELSVLYAVVVELYDVAVAGVWQPFAHSSFFHSISYLESMFTRAGSTLETRRIFARTFSAWYSVVTAHELQNPTISELVQYLLLRFREKLVSLVHSTYGEE